MSNINSPTGELADIYHEIMKYRTEAFERYGGNDRTVVGGPPALVSFPTISRESRGTKEKRFGPYVFREAPPIQRVCARILHNAQEPMRILEIGPGRGDLARELQNRFPNKIGEYFGFDRDSSVSGPWSAVTNLETVEDGFDLVIASEVIEHLPSDEFVTSMLTPVAQKLRAGGMFIVSLPNATSPAGIARDFTHVQAYPWYDLYAVFRLRFNDVRIFRSTYLYGPMRLVTLLPRILICIILEQEWAEGLICVGTKN